MEAMRLLKFTLGLIAIAVTATLAIDDQLLYKLQKLDFAMAPFHIRGGLQVSIFKTFFSNLAYLKFKNLKK